jgi:phosphinothricin acetyltransferase
MILRPVTAADAAAIAALYGHHVLHGAGTFEETPPSADDMAGRIKAVLDKGYPWLVAEDEGRLVAYAYAGPYRERSAYRYTAEDSVYVAHDAQGRGYGRATLTAVIAACEVMGLRQLVAVIGDSRNAGSIVLHRALGFQMCGTLPSVGFKSGRWLDVLLMQKALNGGDGSPPA